MPRENNIVIITMHVSNISSPARRSTTWCSEIDCSKNKYNPCPKVRTPNAAAENNIRVSLVFKYANIVNENKNPAIRNPAS